MLYWYIIGQIIATVIAIALIICLIRKTNRPDPVNQQMFSLLESRVQCIEDTISDLQKTEPETEYNINSIVVLDGNGIVPWRVIKLAYQQGIAFIRLGEYYSMLNIVINRIESTNSNSFNIDALIPVKQSDDEYLLRPRKVTISLTRYYQVTSVWSESIVDLISNNDGIPTVQKAKRTEYAHRGDQYQKIRSAVLRETTPDTVKYVRFANIINALFFPYYYTAAGQQGT